MLGLGRRYPIVPLASDDHRQMFTSKSVRFARLTIITTYAMRTCEK